MLTRARMEDVMRPRRSRPLFIIDIAMPRDVEPGVGDLDQVFLYNIDDLQTIVKENLARRGEELVRAESIVEEEVARFTSWMQSREVVPTVVALRQRFETIRKAELARLEPKMAGLPPEARARIDEVTRLIVEKLLLTPTEQLKGLSDEATATAYADALSKLFSLQETGIGRAGRREGGALESDTRGRLRRMTKLRIGTRGSALALWQARTVAALIEASGAGVELVVIRTAGDRLQQAPLSEVGGKRLFVKEIEDALLAEDIDIAVHSAKDMSAVLPAGLDIGAVLPREDPRDAIVLRAASGPEDFASALLRARRRRGRRHGQRTSCSAVARRPAACPVCRHSRQRRYATPEARGRRLRCAGTRGRRDAPPRTRGPDRREYPARRVRPGAGAGDHRGGNAIGRREWRVVRWPTQTIPRQEYC